VKEDLKLHSKVVLLTVSFLLNPFFGGILLAQNLINTGRRQKMGYPLLFGGVFNLMTSFIIRQFSLPVFWTYFAFNLIGGLILISFVWNENMEKGIPFKAKKPFWPLAIVVLVWTVFYFMDLYYHHIVPKKEKSFSEIFKEFRSDPGVSAGAGKFDLSTPENWIRNDTVIDGIKVSYIKAPLDTGTKFRANMSIVSSAYQKTSLEEFYTEALQSMRSSLPYVKIVQEGKTDLHGDPAKWYTFTIEKGQAINTEGIQFLIMHDHIVYTLTGMSSLGELKKYQPIFEKAAQSFTVK